MLSPSPGASHNHDQVGDPGHLDLALADADRLDEHDVAADEAHHSDDALDAERKAAEMAA